MVTAARFAQDADMPISAVAVRDLQKSYGAIPAVDGVTFTVAPGEVIALLGPNGAGKTPIAETLEGLRPRDGGSVSVLGIDPGDRSRQRELRQRVGAVLQECPVEPYLTVEEAIARHAGYYERPRLVAEVIAA